MFPLSHWAETVMMKQHFPLWQYSNVSLFHSLGVETDAEQVMFVFGDTVMFPCLNQWAETMDDQVVFLP